MSPSQSRDWSLSFEPIKASDRFLPESYHGIKQLTRGFIRELEIAAIEISRPIAEVRQLVKCIPSIGAEIADMEVMVEALCYQGHRMYVSSR